MAVYFDTQKPKDLLAWFDARINQTESKGKIETWEKTSQGFYTHKAADWKSKAFFKPSIDEGRLRFNIIRPKEGKVSVVAYGYYHGHLIETFLNHFDSAFKLASATPLPTADDNVNPPA